MNINRNNYEIYFIDYNDNNLSESQIKELNIFLEKNADLKSEFEIFNNGINAELEVANVNFTLKSELKEITNTLYELTEFEYLAISKIENDISIKEEIRLNEIVINQNKKEEFNRIKRTKLVANLQILFPYKNRIKRTPLSTKIKAIISIAAAVMFIYFTLTIASTNNFKDQSIKKLANLSIPKYYSKKTVHSFNNKIENKIINKKENKVHIGSISHKLTNNNSIKKAVKNETLSQDTLINISNENLVYKKTERVFLSENNNEKITLQKVKIPEPANLRMVTNENRSNLYWTLVEKTVNVWNSLTDNDTRLENKYNKYGEIDDFSLITSNFSLKKSFKKLN